MCVCKLTKKKSHEGYSGERGQTGWYLKQKMGMKHAAKSERHQKLKGRVFGGGKVPCIISEWIGIFTRLHGIHKTIYCRSKLSLDTPARPQT